MLAVLLAVDTSSRHILLMGGPLDGGAHSLRHLSRLLAVRREVRQIAQLVVQGLLDDGRTGLPMALDGRCAYVLVRALLYLVHLAHYFCSVG